MDERETSERCGPARQRVGYSSCSHKYGRRSGRPISWASSTCANAVWRTCVHWRHAASCWHDRRWTGLRARHDCTNRALAWVHACTTLSPDRNLARIYYKPYASEVPDASYSHAHLTIFRFHLFEVLIPLHLHEKERRTLEK